MKTTTRMLKKLLLISAVILTSNQKIAQTNTSTTQTVCVGSLAEPYLINPPTAGSTYQWTLTGGGAIVTGQGTNAITIDWGMIPGGPHTLSVIETDANLCPGVPVIVDVTLTLSATANAGSDDDVCEGSTYTLTGTSASNNAGVIWSSTTGGTFTGGSTLTPTYTPSAADILAGSVTLTLTATGNAPCNDAISTMVLTINPSPTTGPINHW